MQIFWVVCLAWRTVLKNIVCSVSIYFAFFFLNKTVPRTIPATGCWNANMAVCNMKQLNFGLKQASSYSVTLRARFHSPMCCVALDYLSTV